MRKAKAKKLRQLARNLQVQGAPEKTVYRQLKDLYRKGYLPKHLQLEK